MLCGRQHCGADGINDRWVKLNIKKTNMDGALSEGFFALSCQPIKSHGRRLSNMQKRSFCNPRKIQEGFFVATYAAMEGRAAFRRNGAIAEPRNGGGAKAQAVELARHLNGRA